MKTRAFGIWILLADLIWCFVVLIAVEALVYSRTSILSNWSACLPFVAEMSVLWVLLSAWMKLDSFRGGWYFPAVISQLFLAVLCVLAMLVGGAYLRLSYVPRLPLISFGMLLFIGFVGIRYTVWWLLLATYRSGKTRRIVIVGSDRIARELALKIERHPEIVCEVVGFLCPDDNGNLIPRNPQNAVRVSTIGISDLLSTQRVTDMILALPKPSLPEVLNLAGRCRDRGINVSFVPQPYELYLSKPILVDMDGIPILELRQTAAPKIFSFWKRLTDVVLSSVFSIMAIPILFPVAVALRSTKTRAFRWEERCGKGGASFMMLRLNIDRERINGTRLEKVLVNMSVTELPQLWNVLRGEMSLVGPRPDSLPRVKRYSEWEQQRLSIKPGMTGLAQVHGLRDQNSSEEKTRFDLQYILNPSAVADMSILLQTLWTLLMRIPNFTGIAASQTSAKELLLFKEATTRLSEENLQSAHRSQSSAD